jgi:hypothetical protein
LEIFGARRGAPAACWWARQEVESTLTMLQSIRDGVAAGGVRDERLVAHAGVEVEQRQLRAGMRTLTADDDAGAGGVSGQVDHSGQFGHLHAGPQRPVLFQGGVPEPVGQGFDRPADWFGGRVAEGERGSDAPVSQCPQVGEEEFRTAGAVGADQDRSPVAVSVGYLGQGLIEDGEVITGGVCAGVARP